MQERTKRLAIAVVLTAADVAIFKNCAGVIWQAWGRDPWAKVGLFALLALSGFHQRRSFGFTS